MSWSAALALIVLEFKNACPCLEKMQIREEPRSDLEKLFLSWERYHFCHNMATPLEEQKHHLPCSYNPQMKDHPCWPLQRRILIKPCYCWMFLAMHGTKRKNKLTSPTISEIRERA